MAGGFFGGLAEGMERRAKADARERQLDQADETIRQSSERIGIQRGTLREQITAREAADRRGNKTLSLQERRIGVAEQSNRNAQARADRIEAAQIINNSIQAINAEAKKMAASGTPKDAAEGAEKLLEALLPKIKRTAAQAGLDPNAAEARARAAAREPSQKQIAQTQAKAKVAGIKETAKGLNVSTEAVARGAKLLPKQPAASFQNVEFKDKDGKTQTVLANVKDPATIAELNKRGGQIVTKKRTAAGTESLDPTSDALTPKGVKELSDMRQSLGRLADTKAEMARLEEAIKKNPSSVGFVGAGIEFVGGFARQIPALEALAKSGAAAFGVDPQEVADIRASLRASVSGLLEPITRESGRFTESERAEARKVLRGITAESDLQNILGAFKAANRLVGDSLFRHSNSLREKLKILPSDLSDIKKRNEFSAALVRSGLRRTQAVDMVNESMKRFGLQ